MEITVWYSTESMADYIIDHTVLKRHHCVKAMLQESDASKPKGFHAVPDHIKKILYLDAPDIIVEVDSNPIFTIEESKEAGTGHNVFQRFSRLAASAENGIPSFYIYPEAVIIERKKGSVKWDVINPLICHALDRLMSVFNTPALLFFFPSRYPTSDLSPVNRKNKGLLYHSNLKYLSCPQIDKEMREMFDCINLIVNQVDRKGFSAISGLMGFSSIKKRRDWHIRYLLGHSDGKQKEDMSPLSATIEVPTEVILRYIENRSGVRSIKGVLPSREKTIVYKANASFRGDPYPGALASIDYMLCRYGKTFEDRERNLVMVWGDFHYDSVNHKISISGKSSILDFCSKLKQIERHNLLNKDYDKIVRDKEIPRYYMQARYGSMFSKAKDIRVYSYFCDAILFKDGVLWREG